MKQGNLLHIALHAEFDIPSAALFRCLYRRRGKVESVFANLLLKPCRDRICFPVNPNGGAGKLSRRKQMDIDKSLSSFGRRAGIWALPDLLLQRRMEPAQALALWKRFGP